MKTVMTTNLLSFLVILLLGFGFSHSYAQGFPWAPATSNLPSIELYAEFDKPIASPGETLHLTLRGFIEEDWHIYSIHPQPDGPKPTTVDFLTTNIHLPQGPLKENAPLIKQDDALDLQLAVHEKQFIFQQTFKINNSASKGIHDLQGILKFQICDNRICSPLQTQSFIAPLEIQ